MKARREEAQAFKALAEDVENEIGAGLDQYDPELIDGVRVLWISQGCAARDERECLMVCVWEPIPHKEISQNDYCDKTRSGR